MPYGNLGWNLNKFRVRCASAAAVYINVFYKEAGAEAADSVNTSYTLTADTSTLWATIAGVAASEAVRGFTLRCETADIYAAEASVAVPNGVKIPAGVEMAFGDCD